MPLLKVLTLGLGALSLLLLLGGAYLLQNWQQTEEALAQKETARRELEERFTTLQNDYATLQEAFTAEKARNDAFADQIDSLSGTVGKLDKLSRTDPELLQKYSKVYFLNENYSPVAFEKVPSEFVVGADDEYIHKEVWPFLEELLSDAKEEGLSLRVISAFRSFHTQAALKAQYKVTYGSGANTFSADQGYSEHQLGTAVDFTTPSIGSTFTGFETTDEHAWLIDNAYKYGFILSYPHDNTYYQYEPWHWRFVGRELARDLHKKGQEFYELDQRTLDEYLINLFD